MANPFVRKLEGYGPISGDDVAWLRAVSDKRQNVERGVDLIREGDRPEEVHLVMEGLACRYKARPDGSRQIVAYMVPGDFGDLHVALLAEMDHSIMTLAPCSVVSIPKSTVLELTDSRPALTRAFWWCSQVDAAVLREWIVNIGSRPANQRIAHLFCELHARLRMVGQTVGASFALPITQEVLADTVGISIVHMNRSLRELREAGLVTFRDQVVQVSDLTRLKTFAGFNPNYLHRGRGSPAPQ